MNRRINMCSIGPSKTFQKWSNWSYEHVLYNRYRTRPNKQCECLWLNGYFCFLGQCRLKFLDIHLWR